MNIEHVHWDAVIVGTGFGGATTALQLAKAGRSVLVLDRGVWVERDDSAWDTQVIHVEQKYRTTIPYEAPQVFGRRLIHGNDTVGGNSVFYGAASFRLREADFQRRSAFLSRDPRAERFADWPITYDDLAPYYDEAEKLLGVVGVAGVDPCEPTRAAAYQGAPPPYGSPARRVAEAAEQLGLRPFPIPLAINFDGANGRNRCVQCTTCDLYPCKIGAKNDLAVTVLPQAMRHGAVVRDRTAAIRLRRDGGRIVGVECVDVTSGRRFTVRCDAAVAACGAIGSAKLLLASGLDDVAPNGALIGRHLMRHCAGIVIAIFPEPTNPEVRFHKQIALTDFYFGHPGGRAPAGPWGVIQGLQVPPPEFLDMAPFPVAQFAKWTQPNQIFLICIAEDIPNPDNRVTLHPDKRDPFDVPIAQLHHRYDPRDYAGRRALYREAARILRTAGSVLRFRKPIYTFSHAVGTCRFGTDPTRAVLDPNCRMFNVPNLYVVDGSFFPTSGGVNPSLTIAANGLRVGEHMAAAWDTIAPRSTARGVDNPWVP